MYLNFKNLIFIITLLIIQLHYDKCLTLKNNKLQTISNQNEKLMFSEKNIDETDLNAKNIQNISFIEEKKKENNDNLIVNSIIINDNNNSNSDFPKNNKEIKSFIKGDHNNINDKNNNKHMFSHYNTFPFLIFSFMKSSQIFLTELKQNLKENLEETGDLNLRLTFVIIISVFLITFCCLILQLILSLAKKCQLALNEFKIKEKEGIPENVDLTTYREQQFKKEQEA